MACALIHDYVLGKKESKQLKASATDAVDVFLFPPLEIGVWSVAEYPYFDTLCVFR